MLTNEKFQFKKVIPQEKEKYTRPDHFAIISLGTCSHYNITDKRKFDSVLKLWNLRFVKKIKI